MVLLQSLGLDEFAYGGNGGLPFTCEDYGSLFNLNTSVLRRCLTPMGHSWSQLVGNNTVLLKFAYQEELLTSIGSFL
jgi:hypothetical protein